jgi:hypothetical protein
LRWRNATTRKRKKRVDKGKKGVKKDKKQTWTVMKVGR